MLFDNVVRTDIKPKWNLEGSFDFLNRSARPEISRVREFVESCCEKYPTSEIDELIARIRSGDENHFKSATFELLLYEALSRIGFELEPHPQLENGVMARPDFLVSSPDGGQFYLEAVLASEIKEVNQGGEAIKGAVMDVLTSAHHHDFMIDVTSKGYPTTQPSGKKLAVEILKWLDSLDPENIQQAIELEGLDAVEFFKWEHEEWSLTIRPIPLKPDRRGKSKSLIGAFMGGAGYINAWTPIRDAVKYKGSKYGQLGLPFLIAVNVDSYALDPIDEMQALFGQEKYIISVGQPEHEPEMQREPNGAWYGPTGPQYKRVSGAWLFNDLTPYTVASRRSTIYVNPWASKSLPESLLVMPHAKSDGEIMEWIGGKSFREIYGLHEGWPT
ncbi:MAG: hypothetical protein ABII81_05985 [Pseudomonadota bacterium]